VPRLLALFRDPYHLDRADARAWLTRELESVLRSDELQSARLTRLRGASAAATNTYDWLLELRIGPGPSAATAESGSAFADLIGDLRLLGMAPTVVLADDGDVVELRAE
jgi:hypothetical protein